jgi:hypothetical protein
MEKHRAPLVGFAAILLLVATAARASAKLPIFEEGLSLGYFVDSKTTNYRLGIDALGTILLNPDAKAISPAQGMVLRITPVLMELTPVSENAIARLDLNANGSLTATMYNPVGSFETLTTDPGVVSTGVWQNIALVWNRTIDDGSYWLLKINGVQVAGAGGLASFNSTGPAGANWINGTTASNFRFAGPGGDGGSAFNGTGLIDEVRVSFGTVETAFSQIPAQIAIPYTTASTGLYHLDGNLNSAIGTGSHGKNRDATSFSGNNGSFNQALNASSTQGFTATTGLTPNTGASRAGTIDFNLKLDPGYSASTLWLCNSADIGGGGKLIKQLETESLESSDKPSTNLGKVVFRGKVSGGAKVEVTVEMNRGTILAGGRILDPGSLKNPLRFGLVTDVPNLYTVPSLEKDLDDKEAAKQMKDAAKEFNKKAGRDQLMLKSPDGKRQEFALIDKVDFKQAGIADATFTEVELESGAILGRTVGLIASPNSSLKLSKAGAAELYMGGWSVIWLTDGGKDPDGKARLALRVR